jgi:hypothetical protein
MRQNLLLHNILNPSKSAVSVIENNKLVGDYDLETFIAVLLPTLQHLKFQQCTLFEHYVEKLSFRLDYCLDA